MIVFAEYDARQKLCSNAGWVKIIIGGEDFLAMVTYGIELLNRVPVFGAFAPIGISSGPLVGL